MNLIYMYLVPIIRVQVHEPEISPSNDQRQVHEPEIYGSNDQSASP